MAELKAIIHIKNDKVCYIACLLHRLGFHKISKAIVKRNIRVETCR